MGKIYDAAVIGGGPGGYSAALYCARAGMSVVVFEKLSAGGQMASTTQIDNYPGFDGGVDGFELGQKMQNGAEKFGAYTEYAEVTAADFKSQPKILTTSSGEFRAKTVIIATGASPKKLGLPDEESLVGRGVSYCATCDGMFYKDKTVAVAGGGNTAVSEALVLSKICRKVYVVHRRDTLRAEEIYVEKLKKAGNIEFVWNADIKAFDVDGVFKGIMIKDKLSGKEYELACDAVFAAIGRQPDTELAKGQLKLDSGGYVVADETTKTSVPGVFAVGDIRTKPLRQIVTAAADGAVAAKYALEFAPEL